MARMTKRGAPSGRHTRKGSRAPSGMTSMDSGRGPEGCGGGGEGAKAQAGTGIQGSGGGSKASMPARRVAGPAGTTTGAQAESESSARRRAVNNFITGGYGPLAHPWPAVYVQ